jgi:hypothetical protein
MRVIDLCGRWDAECYFDDKNKFYFVVSKILIYFCIFLI